MKTKTSIAIITKNRAKELKKCLNSIDHQTHKPEEIIIVDNDPKQSARKTIAKKKYKKIKFSYYSINGSVPKCRNFAIKVSKTKYLGFIDDDCVLDKNWLKNGLKSITKNKSNYVLGKTLLLNPKSILALAQYSRDNYWKNQNLQIFDTKNVILNLNLFKEKKLKFDENCQMKAYDSADFDFDFLLKKNKLKGIFCKEMILYHKETSDFKRFYTRAYYRGYLAKYLNKKWKLNDYLVDLSTSNLLVWVLKTLKNYHKDYIKYSKSMDKSSFLKKAIAILVIKLFEWYYVTGYVANKKNT